MFKNIVEGMLQGNFSFLILVVGIAQLILMAINLKNHPFMNRAEFDELYNLIMSLNSADCSMVTLEKFS